MKLAIFGAGSLGLTYGAYLSQVADCTILARRSEQADAINSKGVSLSRDQEQITMRPIASIDPGSLADRDIILVLTKAYDAKAAARLISTHARQAVVVSMQSGIGALDSFNTFCESERVLAGISYLGAKRTSDVSVELGENLRTVIGEQDGIESQRIVDIRNLLTTAGFDAEISPSVDRLVWEKMVVIVAQQALSALTGKTFGELRQSTGATSIIKPLLEELEAVAHKRGIHYDWNLIDRVHANWESLPNHRSSTWLDLQIPGNRTEIDFINGAVVRIGREHDIPTPANSLIHELIKLAQSRSSI